MGTALRPQLPGCVEGAQYGRKMSPQPDLRSAAHGSLGLGHIRLLGLAVVPAALALVLGTAGAAAADPPEFTGVVGIPAFAVHGHRAAGAVDLRLLAGGGQVLTEQGLGLAEGSHL